MINWKNEKENLERLINVEHVSYEEIGRHYNVSGAAVKKAAKGLGITLPQKRAINPNEHFNRGKQMKRVLIRNEGKYVEKKVAVEPKPAYCLNCGTDITDKHGKKYCSFKCEQEYRYKDYIRKWKSGEIPGFGNAFLMSKHLKRYLLERANHQCERCGWHETNENHPEPPLQIHHIDGNCLNNNEENLQVLCPNCHALTDNFGSKNRYGSKERTNYFGKGKDGYDKKKEKLRKRLEDMDDINKKQ